MLTRATVDLAAEVLSYGPDAYVVEPGELRDAVVARLDGVLS
ncbi:WYL domain-containing protein [Nocardioides sp. CER28]